MMKMTFLAVACGLSLSLVATASAEDSQAKDWGLTNAELARIDGKVVDVLCELAGDCTANCGDGNRQLGIIDADDQLYYVSKNIQPAFNGAVEDLLPYCGKDVQADGVIAGHSGVTFYQVQLIREIGDEEWNKTNLWTKNWNASHPDLKKVKGPWFRKDPRIVSRIEERGYLGLGLDIDKAYIEEWQ